MQPHAATAYLILAATLAWVGLAGAAAAEGTMTRTVTVSATGQASAEPDTAVISSGVLT